MPLESSRIAWRAEAFLMPYALLAATILSLILHGWYHTTTPLGLTVVAMGAWMGFEGLRSGWRWWRAPRRFGHDASTEN